MQAKHILNLQNLFQILLQMDSDFVKNIFQLFWNDEHLDKSRMIFIRIETRKKSAQTATKRTHMYA